MLQQCCLAVSWNIKKFCGNEQVLRSYNDKQLLVVTILPLSNRHSFKKGWWQSVSY